jgi:hypothetical protein
MSVGGSVFRAGSVFLRDETLLFFFLARILLHKRNANFAAKKLKRESSGHHQFLIIIHLSRVPTTSRRVWIFGTSLPEDFLFFVLQPFSYSTTTPLVDTVRCKRPHTSVGRWLCHLWIAKTFCHFFSQSIFPKILLSREGDLSITFASLSCEGHLSITFLPRLHFLPPLTSCSCINWRLTTLNSTPRIAHIHSSPRLLLSRSCQLYLIALPPSVLSARLLSLASRILFRTGLI